MSAQPVDLEQVAEALHELTETVAKTTDIGTMLAVTSMQINLAMAVDTRRQADATAALVKELHSLRRAK